MLRGKALDGLGMMAAMRRSIPERTPGAAVPVSIATSTKRRELASRQTRTMTFLSQWG